eukprot:12800674-Alexandrium_andersonii.AAC.1
MCIRDRVRGGGSPPGEASCSGKWPVGGRGKRPIAIGVSCLTVWASRTRHMRCAWQIAYQKQ